MSVHLANLRVTRNESAHESATAHTGKRYMKAARLTGSDLLRRCGRPDRLYCGICLNIAKYMTLSISEE